MPKPFARHPSVSIAALVLSLAAVPLVLAHDGHDGAAAPADTKAVTGCVRTGAGAYTYESIPNWCQIPDAREVLGPTHGQIVIDKQGLVYFSMDGGGSKGI